MSFEDLKYFAARAADERERAAAATDPDVSAFHLDLAGKYQGAASKLRAELDLQGSREVIRRSLNLLSSTRAQIPNDLAGHLLERSESGFA